PGLSPPALRRRHHPDARRLQRRRSRGLPLWRNSAIRRNAPVRAQRPRRVRRSGHAGRRFRPAAEPGARRRRRAAGDPQTRFEKPPPPDDRHLPRPRVQRRGEGPGVAREAGGAPSLDKAVFFLHLGRARESLRAGRLEEARQELELARLAHPEDGEVLNLVSIVEFRRGDFAEAARAARALLRTNPESAVLHANLGMIQFKAGALADAERELTRAIELDPGHARGHLYLGLLLRGRGELAGALKHLRRAGARKAAAE